MKRAIVFIIFITLAFSGAAFALGKPDFSGMWTSDEAVRGLAGAKITVVIKQTPTVITITTKMGKRSETVIQKLDGSESINRSTTGPETRSTSHWEGSKLVTKSTTSIGKGTAESTFARSLSADGKVMTIETNSNGSKKKFIYNKN